MELKGRKTYIVIVATICYALGGAVAGLLSWQIAIPLILGALGLSGLRNAIIPELVKTEEVPQRI